MITTHLNHHIAIHKIGDTYRASSTADVPIVIAASHDEAKHRIIELIDEMESIKND